MKWNEMIHELTDLLFTNTIECLEDTCLDEKEWLDTFRAMIRNEKETIFNNIEEDLERNLEGLERKIRWHIANKFNDDKLVNDLIEEEQAERERRLDEYLSSQE